jgi:hypothetical protein
MAFANSVAQEVAGLAQDDPYRIVLEHLRQHGRGRANAKPYPEIETELARHGINMSQTQFQQTLLKRTREGDVFIGSTDQGPFRGYFLIEDVADAEVAREFYYRRIGGQQANLEQLEDLMRQSFPNYQLINYN